MTLFFTIAKPDKLDTALSLLKEAAESIKAKGLKQWGIWLKPQEKQIAWINEGFQNGEFFIVQNENGEELGMFRLSYQDILYWGVQTEEAAYIHSLMVKKQFAGQDLGKKIIAQVEQKLLSDGINLLRLDCNAENRWLCNYYEAQGFVQVGQKQMPHGLNNLYEKKL